MRYALVLVFLLVAGQATGQQIPVIKLADLEKIMNDKEKKILVINFWATWCAPCVKELPFFESLHQSASPDTRVVLINLDFVDKLDRVKSFVARKSMTTPVVLLDEIDYNSWIDKVDPSWQGAIPATLILNTQTGQRKFVAKELEEGQLDQLIKELSNG